MGLYYETVIEHIMLLLPAVHSAGFFYLEVPSLVSALGDISYCGYFVVEVFPSNPQYPEQSIMSHSTHLDLFERILLGEIV